jgi:hypothetical protein
LAASNDIKGSQELSQALEDFIKASEHDNPLAFQQRYEDLLLDQQRNLGLLQPTPIVSLAAESVREKE